MATPTASQFSIPQRLMANGFRKLNPGDPLRYETFPTWEKDGARIALKSESLGLYQGKVLRYDGDGTEITIQAIVVAPEQRRQGAASGLLKIVLEGADDRGLSVYVEPVLFGEVGMTGEQLVAFYQRRGFVSAGDGMRVLVRHPAKDAHG